MAIWQSKIAKLLLVIWLCRIAKRSLAILRQPIAKHMLMILATSYRLNRNDRVGTFQITGPGFGRTLVLAGTHTYVASAFSVNGTFQIMGPSKGSTQGVPISVARLYF